MYSDQLDYPVITFYHNNENYFHFLGSTVWNGFIFYFLWGPNDPIVFTSPLSSWVVQWASWPESIEIDNVRKEKKPEEPRVLFGWVYSEMYFPMLRMFLWQFFKFRLCFSRLFSWRSVWTHEVVRSSEGCFITERPQAPSARSQGLIYLGIE